MVTGRGGGPGGPAPRQRGTPPATGGNRLPAPWPVCPTRRHAAPRRDRHPRAHAPGRALAVPARPRRRGREQGWWRDRLPGRWRCRCRPATTTSWPIPPCATTSATPGTRPPSGCPAAGPASAWSCGSTPPPTGRSCGSDDTEVVAPRGRLHAVRGRRHRARHRRPSSPAHRRRRQPADLDVAPPGHRRGGAGRPTRQTYFHDFFNYAGLHRSVWLHCTPAAHVSDVGVVPDVDRDDRHRGLTVATAGADGLGVRVVLRDADGAEVARGTGPAGELVSRTCTPGGPGEGYLHELTVELADDEGEVRRQLPAAGRHPDGRGARHRVPHQRRTLPLHAASASTRTPRCAARATTTC